jgi:hypothetical protein
MTRLAVLVVVATLARLAWAQPTTMPNQVQPPPPPAAPAPPAAPTAPARPTPPVPSAKPALPAVGESFGLGGPGNWPKLDWLYDLPSPRDAAGKVVIHWFCAPKAVGCTDDLARIVTLKEAGRVYVIAYINGTKGQAQKLDPIRESEGVGRGTVAFGRGATKLMKDLAIAGPASIVVDVEGKVQLVTTTASPADLDARDAKVNASTGAIKEYVAATDGPRQVKPGDKFQLSIAIKLATWLKYSDKTPMELKVTVPPDIKCDTTTLKGDQMKLTDLQLIATVTCSGPRGIYEARGELRFGYDAPGGGTGLGAESARWKFEIKE